MILLYVAYDSAASTFLDGAPAGVDVRKVDLSVELQVLAFLGQQRVPAEVGESA